MDQADQELADRELTDVLCDECRHEWVVVSLTRSLDQTPILCPSCEGDPPVLS